MLLLLPFPLAPADDFDYRLLKFHRAYDGFIRAYLGCPKDARAMEECSAARGILDRRLFEKSRVAARELYKFDNCRTIDQ